MRSGSKNISHFFSFFSVGPTTIQINHPALSGQKLAAAITGGLGITLR
jgi:hypothetical protein